MTEMAQRQELEQAVPLAALFTAFFAVCLYGVGGGSGIVWARRIAVENRRWISDREFADIVSLCQFAARLRSRRCRRGCSGVSAGEHIRGTAGPPKSRLPTGSRESRKLFLRGWP